MGSPTAPLDLTLSDLKLGQSQGHLYFEDLYLVK